MIRVLLVDDQQLIRSGLQRILAPRDGFDVVGECGDGSEVEEAVNRLNPDLVIMDARMKKMGGAEATRQLRQRADSPPVLILTTFDDDEVLSASLRAGASGFQLKDAPGEDLIRAARVEVPWTADHAADAVAGTAARQAQFEAFIRQAPEQWMWAHRKWV